MVLVNLAALANWSRSSGGRQKLRYAGASVLSAVVGQVALLLAFGGLRWPSHASAVAAFGVGALSSYQLNRRWVWARTGRSDLLREVVPFWVVAAVGLGVSTGAIVLADRVALLVSADRAFRTGAVMAASCGSLAVVWFLKYLVLDRYVFAWTGGSEGAREGCPGAARARRARHR